jgi:acyl-CoA reductase-like NAD-dependent aldehyde dehydrogenase
MTFATVNPRPARPLHLRAAFREEVERRIQAAADAYLRHRRTSFAERARMMLRAAEILESEREEFGRLMVTEMGKPIQAARDEAAKSALGCRYYAEHAERFLADEPVATNAAKSWVAYQPIGPGAGDHALEFSLLAGLPLRRAGAHGRQRRAAQARGERPRVRVRDRGDLPPRRVRPGGVPDAADRERAGCAR